MGIRLPDKPTTPAQWQVIAWAGIVLFVVIGSVGLAVSLQAPPEKVRLARELMHYSLTFYGLAVAVYGIKRIVEFFTQ